MSAPDRYQYDLAVLAVRNWVIGITTNPPSPEACAILLAAAVPDTGPAREPVRAARDAVIAAAKDWTAAFDPRVPPWSPRLVDAVEALHAAEEASDESEDS